MADHGAFARVTVSPAGPGRALPWEIVIERAGVGGKPGFSRLALSREELIALGAHIRQELDRNPVAGPDLSVDLPDARSICQYCEAVIEWSKGQPWTSSQGPGLTGRLAECPAHPGEEIDPLPWHKPGRVTYRPEYLEAH